LSASCKDFCADHAEKTFTAGSGPGKAEARRRSLGLARLRKPNGGLRGKSARRPKNSQARQAREQIRCLPLDSLSSTKSRSKTDSPDIATQSADRDMPGKPSFLWYCGAIAGFKMSARRVLTETA
jgi:hypothetical protein